MKRVIFGALILFLVVLLFFLAACGEQEKEKAVNYECDPAEITGETVEERLDSFVSLLNKETRDFSKVVRKDYKDGVISYDLMVYGDFESKKKLFNDFETVLKQLFAWSAQFVAPEVDLEAIVVYYILPGEQGLAVIEGDDIATLKKSPPEAWYDLKKVIPLQVIPMILAPPKDLK